MVGRWEQVVDYRKGAPQLRRSSGTTTTTTALSSSNSSKLERYFRLTGNHDRDLREQRFVDTISSTAGIDMPLASDVLLLRGPDGIDYIICHGHQFDSLHAELAAEHGESLAGRGLGVQGPDRAWRLEFDQSTIGSPAGAASTTPGHRRPIRRDPPGSFRPQKPRTMPRRSGLRWPATQRARHAAQWESTTRRLAGSTSITRAPEAIEEEVPNGDRWFKFRHMNEMRIVDGLRGPSLAHLSRRSCSDIRTSRGFAGASRKGGNLAVADFYFEFSLGRSFPGPALGDRADRRRAVP